MSQHQSRRRRGDDVSVITDARRSPLDDWRHRRHLYAALQLARIPLLVAAVAAYAWLHSPVLAAVFAVISLPLPWAAVLLANEKTDDREKGQPKVYKPALVRQYRDSITNPQVGGTVHGQLDAPHGGTGYTVIDADTDGSVHPDSPDSPDTSAWERHEDTDDTDHSDDTGR
ncbi:MAG: DUF3099 domain-containing protein [Corynebacterium sp.]|jgi:hypothetical protein|uniref:DUF3099 domain-containing protein n=1 Tax=unclassified Corynebacterium TaxID=2624378 RepID=UPI0009FA7D7E|nr:DUF3099 domain-containing protein [Corynebacterium sp. CNJ-954]